MHPLDGVVAKFNRANEHLKLLCRTLEGFIQDDAYRQWIEQDGQSFEVVIYSEPVKSPKTESWGVLIGDVVHNLRSALDHLVWQLALLESGPAPPEPLPRKSPWRLIGFPIVVRPSTWTDVARVKLAGVRPGLSTEFERLQPFVTGPAAPSEEPLAVLEALWNTDKHRHLHLATVSGEIEIANVTFEGFPEAYAQLISKRPPGPLEGRTELARFRVINPPWPSAEMNVDDTVGYDIAFPKGPPANGALVTSALARIYDECARVFTAFEREFPPPDSGSET